MKRTYQPHNAPPAQARLSRPHEDRGWSESARQPPPQGALAADRVHLQEVSSTGPQRTARLPTAGDLRAKVTVKHGSPQVFPKDRRVRKRAEFLRIQQTGSRVMLPSAIVLIAARFDDGPARLGITVTRKFGNAVARNRAKRLFRELFRTASALLPKGADFVVIPKTSAARPLTMASLRLEWTRAAGLLGSRADSLRRALANAAATPQTASPRGSRQ
jgi:ribonuclease P protein component